MQTDGPLTGAAYQDAGEATAVSDHELKIFRDELRLESHAMHTEIREIERSLANHLQEHATNCAPIQPEPAAKKSMFDRYMSVASLIVAIGSLVIRIWKDSR